MSGWELIADALVILIFALLAVDLPDIEDDE